MLMRYRTLCRGDSARGVEAFLDVHPGEFCIRSTITPTLIFDASYLSGVTMAAIPPSRPRPDIMSGMNRNLWSHGQHSWLLL